MITTHTVTSFDKELEKLTRHMLAMGELVKNLIAIAVESLENHNEALVKQAKSIYKQVSEGDAEINKATTALIALWQPKAVDLRFITASIKISSSLDSMGGLANNSVKRASRVNNSSVTKELAGDFKKVAGIVAEMLDEVLQALKESDIERADRVWMRDDEIDDIYKALFVKLQTAMQSNSADIPSYMQIVLAAKNFERLGDYATKLAETVHYIIAGKWPKKQKIKAMQSS